MYTYPEALNAMEKIAIDLFEASWPNADFTVRVAADGVTGTASVDWRGDPRKSQYCYVTINMPVRPAAYRMSADEFRHWAAYLLHEVGHPNETDRAEWDMAVKEGRHKLLNSLEDVREEKCTIGRGIANNATQVFSELIDMLHAKAVAGGYDPNEPQSIGWTLSTLGRAANGYAVDVSDIHAKLDPNGIVGRVVPWALADLGKCQSTKDCRDLSDRIIAAINTAMKEERASQPTQPEPETMTQPSDAEAPEPTGGLDETRAEEEFAEPTPAQDNTPVVPIDDEEPQAGHVVKRDEDEDEDEDEEEVDAPAADMTPEPEPEPEPEVEEEDLFTDEDVEETSLQPTDRDNIVSSGKSAATERQLTKIMRKVLVTDPSKVERPIGGRTVNGSVDTVIGSASKMGRQRALLARALKANDIDSYEGGRLHGRLNRRALHKLVAGNPAVFGKRTTTEGYDTDVQILVDGSGSMSGYRILAAASLALVVAQAASQVGVDCYAHVFTDNGLIVATKGRQKPVGRKFAYMYNAITGGTPLTESLLLAAHLQHKRAGGKRRIMFVISDGDCDLGYDVVKAAGQYVEKLGTEIANLHIGRQAMGMFRNEVAVDVTNVSAVGLKQLTAVLERGAS